MSVGWSYYTIKARIILGNVHIVKGILTNNYNYFRFINFTILYVGVFCLYVCMHIYYVMGVRDCSEPPCEC